MKSLNNKSVKIESIKGKSFTARFLEPGVVSYEQEGRGVALLQKEKIDLFYRNIIGCPLIIDHESVNQDNLKDLAIGWITEAFYDESDGWYKVRGIITDEEGMYAARQYEYVSCAVLPKDVNSDGGVWHEVKYDFEVLDADFNHLAIVATPRYNNATILLNSKKEDDMDKKKGGVFNFFFNSSDKDPIDKEEYQNEAEDKKEDKDETKDNTTDSSDELKSLISELISLLKKDIKLDTKIVENACKNSTDDEKSEEEKKEEDEESKNSVIQKAKNTFNNSAPKSKYMTQAEGVELAKKYF